MLCAQGFSSLISTSEQRGDFHGIEIARQGPVITHLFFAHDSLIFFKTDDKVCQSVRVFGGLC